MSDIGKGDWVECVSVRKRPPGNGPAGGFRIGAVYQVSETAVAGDGTPWLNFTTMPKPQDIGRPRGGWNARNFRPVYRPKSELIENLRVLKPESLINKTPADFIKVKT